MQCWRCPGCMQFSTTVLWVAVHRQGDTRPALADGSLQFNPPCLQRRRLRRPLPLLLHQRHLRLLWLRPGPPLLSEQVSQARLRSAAQPGMCNHVCIATTAAAAPATLHAQEWRLARSVIWQGQAHATANAALLVTLC